MTQLVPFIAPPEKFKSLANAIQEYLAVKFRGKSWRYKSRVQWILEEFELFVGQRPIDRITFIKWDEAQQKRGIQASTINVKAMELRRFLRWCEANEFIVKAPIDSVIKHHTNPKPLPAIFTDPEYEAIKEATKGTYLYYLTVVGRNTGMSLIDCCHLRWASVDMDNLFIHTNRLKLAWRGIDIIYIPILANSDLHLLLQELKTADLVRWGENNDYVHPEAQGIYNFHINPLPQIYSRVLKKLGITGKTFKNWRNTFVSMLANSGMNIALACKITGHKDPAIFTSYIRPDYEALRTGVQSAFQWQAGKETVKELRKPTNKPNQ